MNSRKLLVRCLLLGCGAVMLALGSSASAAAFDPAWRNSNDAAQIRAPLGAWLGPQVQALGAAGAWLPERVRGPAKPAMLTQVVQIGDQHSSSGLLMQEVYAALSLRATEPLIVPKLPPTALPSVIPEVQRLMQKRVSEFN